MELIKLVERKQMKEMKRIPDFRPGDTVRVKVKVVEGGKERLQAFEGVCIERKSAGLKERFTLRKISHGVGVERSFLLHSPFLGTIEVVRRGHVRKARLFYLREKVGKHARVREKMEAREAEPAEAKAKPASARKKAEPKAKEIEAKQPEAKKPELKQPEAIAKALAAARAQKEAEPKEENR